MKKLKDLSKLKLDVSSLMESKELDEITGGKIVVDCKDTIRVYCEGGICAGGLCEGGII
ncbi:MAG: hypothetical protein HXX16_12745 [Bacteroidales bacterium]|nr:hypothetical protein [Bacteroidales bacterium]